MWSLRHGIGANFIARRMIARLEEAIPPALADYEADSAEKNSRAVGNSFVKLIWETGWSGSKVPGELVHHGGGNGVPVGLPSGFADNHPGFSQEVTDV